jgi:hypothetical protein
MATRRRPAAPESKFLRALRLIHEHEQRLVNKLNPAWSILLRLAPWGTIVALILAIKTDVGVHQAARQVDVTLRLVDSIAPELESISQAISTQYLDSFPGNMEDIIEVIESADVHLTVMCDMPAYGAYSAPGHFKSMKSAYMDAYNRKVKIQLIHYSDSLMNLFTRAQLQGRPFVDRLSDTTFRVWAHENQFPIPMSEGQFFERLDTIQAHTIAHFENQCGTERKTVSAPLPFFAWIADGKVAVISFWGVQGASVAELTFRTTDPKMIDAVYRVIRTVKKN